MPMCAKKQIECKAKPIKEEKCSITTLTDEIETDRVGENQQWA